MEREEGGENWMLGWSWLMGCAKEHGIKKVEKVKRDKRRWRVEKRRMRRRSSGIEKDEVEESGVGVLYVLSVLCVRLVKLHVTVEEEACISS